MPALPQSFDQFSQLLNSKLIPEAFELRGKFHSHITVLSPTSRFDELKTICRQNKAKLTIIDLENLSGLSQTDVMATSYFFDETNQAIQNIVQKLAEKAVLLQTAKFEVQRIKLEHESLPSFESFDREHYHEVHFKLNIPASDYEHDHQRLIEIGKTFGFAPSRNPLDRNSETVSQFVNLRIFQGDQTAANQKVLEIETILELEGFSIVEVKQETVVLDTNQKLDRWWMQE